MKHFYSIAVSNKLVNATKEKHKYMFEEKIAD